MDRQYLQIFDRSLIDGTSQRKRQTKMNRNDSVSKILITQEYKNLVHCYEPFVWYTIPPPSPNLEFFKLPRKHETDQDFLQPFNGLGFFSILRYFFPRFTIRPDGKYLTRYEWFRALCAVLSSIVFPCYTYLVLQFPWLYYVATLLDVSAYFDVFQRTLVAYFNELGILVYHPASTAAHYLKGAFIVDVLACLPLEYFESERSYDHLGQGVKRSATTQFLMLNRVGQLYRVHGAMDIFTIYIERRDILFVIKALPLFMAFINVLVCFVIFLSVSVYQIPEDGWRIIPLDGANSWLNLFADKFRFNMTETPWNLHLAVHFWVVYETVSTGFNIFQPSNIALVQVFFIGKLIAVMMITFFAVRVLSIRSNVNKPLATFQENMKDIAAYMKRENLSKDLQKDVMNYYTHNWNKMGGTDYLSVLKLCDQITLRSDAILHIYGNTFEKCPILSHCDVSLLRIVGRAVHSVYFQEGMLIIQEDDVIEDMYFIDHGFCALYENNLEYDGEGAPCIKLVRGSVFGNLKAEKSTRCRTTIFASSDLHLLQINSVIFYKIIEDFPTVKVLLKKYCSRGESFIVGNLVESMSAIRSWKEISRNLTLIKASRKSLMTYLHRNSKFTDIYLIAISMACVYCDVYNAGFNNNCIALIVVLYFLDMLFFMKILLHYALPFMVDEDHLRQKLVNSRIAYYKGEFKYDIISCLPIELFCFADPKHQWQLFSILRLNRMFRVITVYNCITKYKARLNINLVLTTIITVFIWFTLVVHCTTCLWYYIGVWEENRSNGTSWFYDSAGQMVCNNAYVCSLYFILTTFTQNGVGDILPKMKLEVIFVSILQILSTMMFMVYVGEFSNIIQYQSFRSFSFYSKYLELQDFLSNNRVSRNLIVIVNQYCLHLWRETRGLQIPYFLETAPHCLRLTIMSAAYMHHLTTHPVFKQCEPAFLRQLVGCFRLYIYNENLYVAKQSEITDSMYFIHKGYVQEIAEECEEKTQVFSAGQYFGMLQGLTRDTPFSFSYQTIIHSQVLTLCLDDWEPFLVHFPKSRDIIFATQDNSPDDDKHDKVEKKHVQIQEKTRSASESSDKGPSLDGSSAPGSLQHPKDKRRPSLRFLSSSKKPRSSIKIDRKSQSFQYPVTPETASEGHNIADHMTAPPVITETPAVTPLFESTSTSALVSEQTPLSEPNQLSVPMVEKPAITEGPLKSELELKPLIESASPTALMSSTSPMQLLSMTKVEVLSQSRVPTVISSTPPIDHAMVSASSLPPAIISPLESAPTPELQSDQELSTAPNLDNAYIMDTRISESPLFYKPSTTTNKIEKSLIKPSLSPILRLASTTSAATLTEDIMTTKDDEPPSEILLPLHSLPEFTTPSPSLPTTSKQVDPNKSKPVQPTKTKPEIFEEIKVVNETYPNVSNTMSDSSTRKSINVDENYEYDEDEHKDIEFGRGNRLSIMQKVKDSAKNIFNTESNHEIDTLDDDALNPLAQDEATTAALLKEIEEDIQKNLNKETKLSINEHESPWPLVAPKSRRRFSQVLQDTLVAQNDLVQIHSNENLLPNENRESMHSTNEEGQPPMTASKLKFTFVRADDGLEISKDLEQIHINRDRNPEIPITKLTEELTERISQDLLSFAQKGENRNQDTDETIKLTMSPKSQNEEERQASQVRYTRVRYRDEEAGSPEVASLHREQFQIQLVNPEDLPDQTLQGSQDEATPGPSRTSADKGRKN